MTNIFSPQIVNSSTVEKIHINNFCDNVIKMINKRIILLKKWQIIDDIPLNIELPCNLFCNLYILNCQFIGVCLETTYLIFYLKCTKVYLYLKKKIAGKLKAEVFFFFF